MEPGIHCRRYGNRIVVNPARQHDAVAGVAFPYFGGIENPLFAA